MRDFRFYVSDGRYSVPTLHFVQARDTDRAQALAQKLLDESDHHLGVEVWVDETLLFHLGERQELDGL